MKHFNSNGSTVLGLLALALVACGGTASPEPAVTSQSAGADSTSGAEAPDDADTGSAGAASGDDSDTSAELGPIGDTVEELGRFRDLYFEMEPRVVAACEERFDQFQDPCFDLNRDYFEVETAAGAADEADDPSGVRAATLRLIELDQQLTELEAQIATASE